MPRARLGRVAPEHVLMHLSLTPLSLRDISPAKLGRKLRASSLPQLGWGSTPQGEGALQVSCFV
jgi:hypothetical protein